MGSDQAWKEAGDYAVALNAAKPDANATRGWIIGGIYQGFSSGKIISTGETRPVLCCMRTPTTRKTTH